MYLRTYSGKLESRKLVIDKEEVIEKESVEPLDLREKDAHEIM